MVDVAHAPAGQFNPLDTARRLKAAGCNPDVAEAVAGEFVIALGGLATKADLDAQDARLDEVATRLRAEVQADLSSAVNRMMVAQAVLAGVILAGVAAIVALFQLPT